MNSDSPSPAYLARQAKWHAEWSRIGMNTAPALRGDAEAAIARVYRDSGKALRPFIWVDSPRSAVSLLGVAADQNVTRPDDGRLFIAELHTRLSEDSEEWVPVVRRPARDDASIQFQIHQHVENDQHREFAGQFTAWNSKRGQYSVSPQVMDGFFGQNLDLLRRYTFSRDVIGDLPAPSMLADAWVDIARSCGWWWPRQRMCVVSERPSVIHCDARGRLHHASQAALQFRDGYSFYIWHGTRVPEDWIKAPGNLHPEVALTWPNTEQRRAAAEIVGWARVLDRLHPRVIDKDRDPGIGDLLEAMLSDVGRMRFLRVRCGTGRHFVLTVPPWVHTAREANAWTYGLEPDEYHLDART